MDHPQQPRIVPSALEIQRAHDLLVSLIEHAERVGAVPPREPPGVAGSVLRDLCCFAEVMCWLLGHDNTSFAEKLVGLESVLEDFGITLTDEGRLRFPAPHGRFN